MRTKFHRIALLTQVQEMNRNREQQIKFFRHCISVRLEKKWFELFDIVARAYNLYYLMIFSEAFELIRLNFHEYIIIVQKDPFNYIIEIKEK